MSASAVYEGWRPHRRFEPIEHSFRYRLFRMLVRYPAMSLRVGQKLGPPDLQIVGKIYAQALRLEPKGAEHLPRPEGRGPKGSLSP